MIVIVIVIVIADSDSAGKGKGIGKKRICKKRICKKCIGKKCICKKGTSGGGLVPQNIVNLGSDLSYNFKSVYNSLNGHTGPTNPSPYEGHFSNSGNNYNRFNF